MLLHAVIHCTMFFLPVIMINQPFYPLC
jgi:hypothetical protein